MKMPFAFASLLACGAALSPASYAVKADTNDYLLKPTSLFNHFGGSPKDWGMSRACARMVRKNKMRRLGISAQRI